MNNEKTCLTAHTLREHANGVAIDTTYQHGVSLLRVTGDNHAAVLRVASELMLEGRADVVVAHTEPTLETLQSLVTLLGGDRDSGPFTRIRDIRYNPGKSKSVAESTGKHPFHVDASWAEKVSSYFVLQAVITDSMGGGVSQFLPIAPLLNGLSKPLLDSLYHACVGYARDDDSGNQDAFVSSMLSAAQNGGLILRWRDDQFVQPEVKDARNTAIHTAISHIRRYIANAQPLEYAAVAGDAIIVKQTTNIIDGDFTGGVFHGRTALSNESSPRWMRRVWIA